VLSESAGGRVVITGPTSGVGEALARSIASAGAHVVLAARDVGAAEAQARALQREGGRASVVALDLADLASVRRAAEHLGAFEIDTLVNNAAVAGARGTTRDGFELAFGTNYLGHFALTCLLLPRISRRIVHLGSGAHASVEAIDWSACRERTRSLTGIREYAVSKLAVALFHHELSRRLAAAGPLSVLADPGNVASRAYRHVPAPFRQLWTCGMPSAAEGARTPLLCVLDEVEAGASYVGGRRFTPSRPNLCPTNARQLWEHSVRWAGLDLPSDGSSS
jgi:NAD(P)-dependent dehydrogenase (short-subunit alcohol dehydrogenase family)